MHQALEFGQAVGVGLDKRAVDPVFPQQQMQNPVEQRHIRARQDG